MENVGCLSIYNNFLLRTFHVKFLTIFHSYIIMNIWKDSFINVSNDVDFFDTQKKEIQNQLVMMTLHDGKLWIFFSLCLLFSIIFWMELNECKAELKCRRISVSNITSLLQEYNLFEVPITLVGLKSNKNSRITKHNDLVIAYLLFCKKHY